jgi:hypothetical protein
MANQQIYELTTKVAAATDVIPIQDSAGAADAKKVAVSALNQMVTGYKVYTAIVNPSGGTPSVIQLKNTIGDGSGTGANDIVWTIPSAGVLRGTISGVSAFTDNKTIFFGTSANNGTVYFITSEILGFSIIDVNIVKHDGTQSSTPNVDVQLEIRVYN